MTDKPVTGESVAELRECPFCASRDLMLPYMHEGREAHIQCRSCGAHGPENLLPYGTAKDRDFDKGIWLWNTRPVQPIVDRNAMESRLKEVQRRLALGNGVQKRAMTFSEAPTIRA